MDQNVHVLDDLISQSPQRGRIVRVIRDEYRTWHHLRAF
jgi:hypothetical protein